MQKGHKIEEEFVKTLDNKKISEISKELQELLYSIFNDINNNDLIHCWRSKYLEKSDIKVKINNSIKGISIKSGYNCSMHQENINRLIPYLQKMGIEDHVINILINFITGRINNEKVNAKIYIEKKQKEIEILSKELNNYYIKSGLITRFIIQGTELQRYGCDCLVYGTPKSFLWATKNELLKFLVESEQINNNSISIGSLNLKCYDRNLNNNPNRINKERDIQIKWYKIKDDLLYISKIREINKLNINKVINNSSFFI